MNDANLDGVDGGHAIKLAGGIARLLAYCVVTALLLVSTLPISNLNLSPGKTLLMMSVGIFAAKRRGSLGGRAEVVALIAVGATFISGFVASNVQLDLLEVISMLVVLASSLLMGIVVEPLEVARREHGASVAIGFTLGEALYMVRAVRAMSAGVGFCGLAVAALCVLVWTERAEAPFVLLLGYLYQGYVVSVAAPGLDLARIAASAFPLIWTSFISWIENGVCRSRTARESAILEGEKTELLGGDADKLSPREAQVANLVLEGLSSSEVAKNLGIKPSTVRENQRRIYAKLEVAGLEAFRNKYATVEEVAELSGERTSNTKLEWTRALCALTSIALLLPWGALGPDWGQGQTDLWAIAIGLGVSYFVNLQELAGKKRDSTWRCRCLAVPALVLLLVAMVGNKEVALFSVMGRFAIAVLLGGVVTTTRKKTYDEPLRCLIAVAIGVAVEETWRSAHWFSFAPAASLLICPLSIYWAGHEILRGDYRLETRILVAANAALALVTAIMSPNSVVTAVLSFFLANLIGALFMRLKDEKLNGTVLLAGSLGIAAGCYAVNMLGGLLTYHPEVLGRFGTQTGLEVITIVGSAMMFAGAGIVAIKLNTRGQGCRDGLGPRGRVQAPYTGQYDLAKKGLNDLQVAVVVGLSRGDSVKELAQELHYSPSSIRKARKTALSLLGVSSIEELLKEENAGR